MVKILEVELSTPRLILRIFMALLLFAISLAVLYVTPMLFISILSNSAEGFNMLALVDQLVNPVLPTLGIMISVIVFSTIIVRKTRLEGPLILALGAALILYSYIMFQYGAINLQIPPTEIQNNLGVNYPVNINMSLTINASTLMFITMLTPFLMIIKGAVLTTRMRNVKADASPTSSAN